MKSRGDSLGAEVKLEINGTATFGKNTLEDSAGQDPIQVVDDYEPMNTGIMCSTGPVHGLTRLQELAAVDELGSGNLEDLKSFQSEQSPS